MISSVQVSLLPGIDTQGATGAEMVAKVLGVATSTAYELMHEKDFPALKIGNRLLVPKEKFQAWVETKTKGGEKQYDEIFEVHV